MSEIKIEINYEELSKKIKDAKDIFDTKGFLKAGALRVHKWVIQNFDNEGGNVGGWPPLKESTIARRRNRSTAILKDTGALRRSYDSFGIRGYKLGRNYFEIGSIIEYARFHHEGYEPKNVPARKQLPDSKIGKNLLLKLANAYLDNMRRKYGGN